MRLVELPPAEPLQQRQAPVKTEPRRDAPKPARATPAPVMRRQTSQEATREDSTQRMPHTDAPKPPQTDTATTTTTAPQQSAASMPAAAGVASHDANETSQAGSSTQARPLSQPLPALPDDLREDAYRAEAVARFHIHVDGSIDVELVKPTQNPRLNQILLDTLHRWRFFPAMENGHPVDSYQDVRVHFNVG